MRRLTESSSASRRRRSRPGAVRRRCRRHVGRRHELAHGQRHDRVGVGLRPAGRILRHHEAVERLVIGLLPHDRDAETCSAQRRPRVRDGLQRDVGDRDGLRAARDRERHGGAAGRRRVPWRRLVDDLAGRTVALDVDPSDREARELELRRGDVVARADDVRDRHRLRTLRDVDPHRGALDEDRSRARILCSYDARRLVRRHLGNVGVEAGARQLGDCGVARLPDQRRHRDLLLARRDADRDDAPLRKPGTRRRLLLEDVLRLDVRVREADNLGLEPVACDQLDGVLLEDALVVVDDHRVVRVELVLDVVVEEPGADPDRDRHAGREEPRPPHAPSPHLALVGAVALVAAVARRAPGRRNGGRGGRLAAKDHRRCLLGLRPDGLAAADELEVAVHLLRRPVPLRGLLGERAEDDEVEVPGDLVPNGRGRLRHLREVLHRDLDGRLARERDLAGEQLVEDDPGRVEIGRLVDGRATRLLGREVLGGADDRARLGHLAGAGARDAEVRHLDAALVVDEHVVRLDVSVDDAVPVRVAERGEHLADVGDGDGHGTGAARDDQLLEGAPLDVLHDDEVRALGLAPVVDGDDVRVGEPRRMGRLAAEALDELHVVRVPLVEHLDRDLAAELLVLGEPDVGHAPRAELPLEPVAAGEDRAASLVDGRHEGMGKGRCSIGRFPLRARVGGTVITDSTPGPEVPP